MFWLRNFFIKGQQLFWPSNIKTDFYALHTSIIASYFHLASVIIYLWSDRMFLILFLHYSYQWKIVTLPLTVQNNIELFHKCRSKSTSFTWMKSRSALCSMKEPFCQMNCGIGRVHLFLTCQLGFSPLAIIANFFRYTFGMPSSTCLWEKYDYDIESSALVKAERAAD